MLEGYILLTADFALTYLLTALDILLYSLIIEVIGVPILIFGTYLFEKFKEKKDNWLLDSFLSSFVISLILILIIYFYPMAFMGWGYSSAQLVETFLDGIILVFLTIVHLVYVSLIVSVLSVPLIMFASYINSKIKVENKLLKNFILIFVLAIITLTIITIFPWIVGGLIILIFS